MASRHVQRRLSVLVLLLIVIGATWVPAARAQQPFAIAVVPSAGAPGTELRLGGYGFSPNMSRDILLIGPDGSRMILGSVLTTAEGTIPPTPLVIPSIAGPGDYTIAINWLRIAYATAPLTIRPAPTLALEPAEGASGDLIALHIEGLAAGTLQVHYDGAVVSGPLEVAAGSYSGSFAVPPGSQERGVMVEVINMANGSLVGSARADFSEHQATSTPIALRDVVLPTGPLVPGQQFSVSGFLDPAPAPEVLAGYQLHALWKNTDGLRVPIESALAELRPDGSFELSLRAPSLLGGDAITARDGDQLELSLVSPAGAAVKWNSTLGVAAPKALEFEAVKDMPATPEDGQPIPSTPWPAGQPDPLRVAIAPVGTPFLLPRDDIANLGRAQAWLDISDLWDSPRDQQIMKAADKISNCWGRKFTTKIPEHEWYTYEWAGLPEESLFARPAELTLVDLPAFAKAPIHQQQGQFQPTSVASALEAVPQDMVPARVFQVLIDASRVIDGEQHGYGFVKDGNIAQPYIGLYVYVPELNRIFVLEDDNGNVAREVFAPVQVRMPPLPPGWTTELRAGKLAAYAPGQHKIEGSIYSFVDYMQGPFPPSVDVRVQPGHDRIDVRAYPLKSSTGEFITNFSIDYENDGLPALSLGSGLAAIEPASDGDCGSPGNPEREYYSIQIPNADRLPPGDHVITFSISDGVNSANTQLTLHYVAPPAWINDPAYLNRAVEWALNRVKLSATRYDDSNATVEMPTADLDAISDRPDNSVDNTTGGDLSITQYLGPTGVGSIMTAGQTRTEAINATSSPAPIAKPNSFGAEVKFGTGEEFQQLFATQWIPVFRYIWGVPPLASATIDLRTKVSADLKYNGKVTLDSQGSISDVEFAVNPRAKLEVDAGIDASLLFDIAEAGAHALPTIGLNMPIVFKNGEISKFGACFFWKLDVHVYAEVGVGDFSKRYDATKTILPYDEICLDLAKRLAVQQAGAAEDSWKLPTARPAIATDGFGNLLLLWRAGTGELVYQAGLDAQPQPLPGARHGALKPQVAFYAPGRAVAVWAENALDPALAEETSFEDAVKLQHLVYALWNGTGWEGPWRLTEPTTGDGNVALAGCIQQHQSSCPPGGAVTAVWTHDEAGDLAARNFRVYAATFDGASGMWGETSALDDGASSSNQPTVSYSGGRALAAWVWDDDHDLGTLDDRGLALRYLDHPDIQLPDGLRGAVSSPSLAVGSGGQLALTYVLHESGDIISSRTSLHVVTCSDASGCDWQPRRLTDQQGRAIYAERPVATLDDEARLTVSYRQLGLGPATLALASIQESDPADAPDGAIAQVEVDPLASVVSPTYRTSDDALYAHVAAVYDPLRNATLMLAARGPLPPGATQGLRPLRSTDMTLFEDSPEIMLGVAPRRPDFVVAQVEVPADIPLDGQPFSVQAHVGNAGIGSGESLELVATWEDGTQVMAAGRETIAGLAAGEQLDLDLAVAPPPGGFTRPQRLVVTINPVQRISEQDVQNNRREVTIGALPALDDLSAASEVGTPLIFLQWTPSNDPRVIGYRIYRLDGSGIPSPAGSSMGAGWVDSAVALDTSYRYAVASFSADGVAGPLGDPITALVSSELGGPARGSVRMRVHLPLVASQ